MSFVRDEELVDKIGMDAHSASKKKLDEYLGEGMILVHRAEHLFPLYLECRAVGNRSGSRPMQRACARQRLFSNKLSRGEESDSRFFAIFGNDSELCATILKIEDGDGGFSLRKKVCCPNSLTILRPSPAFAK